LQSGEELTVCGICGVRRFDSELVGEAILLKMRDIMRHRGPDDKGLYVGYSVGLGNRRLSVVDLVTGNQPMHNEDKTIWITLNGEIYNHEEIRAVLEQKGHNYYSRSDTETIVHAYEEYGKDCVQKLNGMFAFAIWDSNKDMLLLARDRLGQKPLYYSSNDERLVFASEIKSLLEYPDVEREIDIEALNLYLTFLYVPAPWTMFKGIKKLPPGHLLTCKGREIQIEKYWDVVYRPFDIQDEGYYIGEIRRKLTKSVEKRLMSDVPLGAFLSGGVDSSVVVGLMSRIMGRPVDTYSVGFDASIGGSPKFNVDFEHARLVAKHFGTNHHEIVISKNDDLEGLLPKLVWQLDEPLSNPTIIPTYFVAKLAKESVTVTLSGDGGDELFGGYTRYRADKMVSCYRRIPAFLREKVLAPLIHSTPMPQGLKRLAEKASLPLGAERYLTWWTVFTPKEQASLFTKSFVDRVEQPLPERAVSSFVDNVDTGIFQDRLSYTDLKMWIAEESNMRMDKMSMLASVEARAPFLDHELVEFAATIIPFSLKVKGLTTKYILKKAFSDMLPEAIIGREKWGFFCPASSWLRDHIKDLTLQLLSRASIESVGLFNYNYVDTLLQRHLNREEYNLNKVWALLTFQLWYEISINQNREYIPKGRT
jgi:asparagine synthase (glutamine-hydrolysing)